MPPAAVVKAQTTKQAKASYKARGNSLVSDSEKKWLQRGLELEQRAERLQEQEKRRAEIAKKKAAKEKAEAKVKEQAGKLLGTQVRLDRFGHKSSQFHLGNFFARPQVRNTSDDIGDAAPEDALGSANESDGTEDFLDDDDIDDQSLLEALGNSASVLEARDKDKVTLADVPPVKSHPTSLADSIDRKCPDGPDTLTSEETDPLDLSYLWDELESSTQIARELNLDANPVVTGEPRKDSFGSDSFDLTLDDVERLDHSALTIIAIPPTSWPKPITSDAKLSMALPRDDNMIPGVSHQSSIAARTSPCNGLDKMLPPALPTSVGHQCAPRASYPLTKSNIGNPNERLTDTRKCTSKSKHNCNDLQNAHTEFTASQLESLIDDDLQLTQMDQG